MTNRQYGERIGGPISANLLDAYDIDQRLAAQKEQRQEQEEQESVESESEDSAESDDESRTRRAIVESFLAGQDEEFDYGPVDNDPNLDDLVMMTREEEEKFFDGEEESFDVPNSEEQQQQQQLQGQTGILDY